MIQRRNGRAETIEYHIINDIAAVQGMAAGKRILQEAAVVDQILRSVEPRQHRIHELSAVEGVLAHGQRWLHRGKHLVEGLSLRRPRSHEPCPVSTENRRQIIS